MLYRKKNWDKIIINGCRLVVCVVARKKVTEYLNEEKY